MKKTLFLTMALCFQSVFAQVEISGNQLMKDGQTYKMSKYNDVFKNPQALSYFKKARTNNTVGTIFAGLGGGVMGVGLARALSGVRQRLPLMVNRKSSSRITVRPGPPWESVSES